MANAPRHMLSPARLAALGAYEKCNRPRYGVKPFDLPN
jgi:hypothetical protein